MDGFFGIGLLELFLIAILALIVLGPERLPGAMRQIADVIRQIRRLGNEFTSQFGDELKTLDELNPKRLINEITDPNYDQKAKPKPAVGAKAAAKPAAKPKPLAPEAATVVSTTAAAAAAAEADGSAPAAPAASADDPGQNTILPPATKPAAKPAADEPDTPAADAAGTGGQAAERTDDAEAPERVDEQQ